MNNSYFYKNNLYTVQRLAEIYPKWKDRNNIKSSFENQKWNYIANMTPGFEIVYITGGMDNTCHFYGLILKHLWTQLVGKKNWSAIDF